MSNHTGFDAAGNYLPATNLVDIIDGLNAEIARLRAALEDVRRTVQTLMPDGWSDATYVINVIDKALANEEGK